MGVRRDRVAMGSGAQRSPAGVCSGTGGVGWWWGGIELLVFVWSGSGMVPTGSGSSIYSRASREPRLYAERELHQYASKSHASDECLQHGCDEPEHYGEQHRLCEPECERRINCICTASF